VYCDSTVHQSRRWSVYYFWREGVPHSEHLARCPRTVAALESWPRCEIPGSSPSAVFSILDARTRIPPHHGVNNARLIVHLPLIAWNDSNEPRAVMIFDIWNPARAPRGTRHGQCHARWHERVVRRQSATRRRLRSCHFQLDRCDVLVVCYRWWGNRRKLPQ
jgi:aspartyl/asparaginyl beta-hydroxylase (cupin superfamily)